MPTEKRMLRKGLTKTAMRETKYRTDSKLASRISQRAREWFRLALRGMTKTDVERTGELPSY